MKIVETDTFCWEYPKEEFLNLPYMSAKHAQRVADLLNEIAGHGSFRRWKVVDNQYELQPGFKPNLKI